MKAKEKRKKRKQNRENRTKDARMKLREMNLVGIDNIQGYDKDMMKKLTIEDAEE